MKITLCGSIHHINGMLAAKKKLEALGYEVEAPDLGEESGYAGLSDERRAAKKLQYNRSHIGKISDSDAIFVYNKEKKGVPGYVGGSSLMEMALAYAQGIEIFLLNDAREMGYADEIYGMGPIVLDGKVEAIHAYFTGLLKTFVSSKSPIKLRAVSRGMRRAGIRTQVLSKPTSSNVSEQPMNIEETYEGAQNRHATLKQEIAKEKPTYLATVESGFSTVHAEHNTFECQIVMLEKAGSEIKTGISVNVEYPKAMTDKVPSKYQDIGELAQIEYGSKLKDPFPYFTNGKVSRLNLLESAVFTVATQL
jgi:non-canonical (house-cleaning) NTP pyrophosphatase